VHAFWRVYSYFHAVRCAKIEILFDLSRGAEFNSRPYLLLLKYQSCYVGNKPFADKRRCYTFLEQQREIQEMTNNNLTWTRELIQKRKEKIIQLLIKL
jgi:hypothetical protein